MLYNFQFQFRPNHSTNLCLEHISDKILKGFDEGLLTRMVVNEVLLTGLLTGRIIMNQ